MYSLNVAVQSICIHTGGFLLAASELWLKEDMRKNIRILAALDLLPSLMGTDWSFLFLQSFEGSITLTPNVRLLDYFKLIDDPTRNDMIHYMSQGRLCTYKKMSMISNRIRIQQCIEHCIQSIGELIE